MSAFLCDSIHQSLVSHNAENYDTSTLLRLRLYFDLLYFEIMTLRLYSELNKNLKTEDAEI